MSLEPGPKSWEECMEWPRQSLQILKSLLGQKAQDNDTRSIVMTSSFSGVGTAELAGAMVQKAFSVDVRGSDSGGKTKSTFVAYSSCDSDKHCQQFLLQQEHHRHVFGNTCDVFDEDVISALKSRLRQNKKKVDNGKMSFAAAGEDLCNFVRNNLAKQIPKETSHCLKCDHQCKRYPGPEFDDFIWLDVAGSPCIPWTPAAYGNSEKWLHHQVTPAYFSWLCGLLNRNRKPDIILHENVPNFDFESPYNALMKDYYDVQSVIASPSDMGLPVARPRRYTLYLLKKHKLLFRLDEMIQSFCRNCVMDASLFLQCSDRQVEEDFQVQVSRKKDLKPDMVLSDYDLMTEKELSVLHQMQRKAMSFLPSE